MINSNEFASIMKALTESGYEEAEVKLDDVLIRVSNRPGSLFGSQSSAGESAASRNLSDDIPQQKSSSPSSAHQPEKNMISVKSPSLGTFYHAPSPGAAPFVNIGDRVTVGQQIGIVEVMKLFNAVESDVAGTVIEIHVKDATLVEYDEPLITIAVD